MTLETTTTASDERYKRAARELIDAFTYIANNAELALDARAGYLAAICAVPLEDAEYERSASLLNALPILKRVTILRDEMCVSERIAEKRRARRDGLEQVAVNVDEQLSKHLGIVVAEPAPNAERYRAKCSCGWKAVERHSRDRATHDLDNHQREPENPHPAYLQVKYGRAHASCPCGWGSTQRTRQDAQTAIDVHLREVAAQ